MTPYRLEVLLTEACEAGRDPFAAAIGVESRLRLGGGTALGLRWGHRLNTDIDFSIGLAYYENARDAIAELGAAFEGRANIGDLKWRGGGFECVVGWSTPVSLFPVVSITQVPVSADTIEGSDVHLYATPEVLAKELLCRVGESEVVGRPPGIALTQNVCDLAYASHYHPALFVAAAEGLRPAVPVHASRHLRATHPAVIGWEGRGLHAMADGTLEFGGRDVVVATLERHFQDRLPFPPRCHPRTLGWFMLDVETVREFYFNPPPDDELRFPTVEECYAR